jgi:two-component system cell cycle sensor histidine kinase PleC
MDMQREDTISPAPTLARHNFQPEENLDLDGLRSLLRPGKRAGTKLEEAASGAEQASELSSGWQGELLEISLKNQITLAPLIPMLALLMAVTAMLWVPAMIVMAWLIGTLGAHSLQLHLCNRYFKKERDAREQRDWIGLFAASEFLQGTMWVASLYFFWSDANSIQNSFLFATITTVHVMRLLVIANFMPVLAAGAGTVALGMAGRCMMEQTNVHYAMAAVIIALEIFFLFVSRQLQETARERLIFKAEKDALIKELQSERDRAEEERKKADMANKAKSSFLANMSHELRTPLNAILGFSEVLEREMFGPLPNTTYKGYAGDIHNSGRHLLDLINDILDLSRIEAGRKDLADEPVALNEAGEQARRLLEVRAAEKSLTLAVRMPADLPKVMADRRSIEQILINLATNAVKFTQAGGEVTISAHMETDGRIALVVADNGPGIPKLEQRQALAAFARGAHATKQAIEGAGLGLPIVNGLMEAHGGTLEINSTQGEGTSVICRFPSARVLTGPRGEVLASPSIASETQRKLLVMTG